MSYTQTAYKESEAVAQAREALAQQNGAKPADYQSQWQEQLDSAIESILNRKDFSYDVNADALYRQYKDSFTNQGKLAMMDTMGQAAMLTGGYGNSYAQIAGQQAYQGYLQQLGDKIPELYQLALDRYNQEGQALYDRAGLLSDREQQDYSRYQDLLSAWNQERAYLTDQFNTERDFDYGAYRDLVSDQQWIAEFEEDLRRYEQEHAVTGSEGGGTSGSAARTQTAQNLDVEAVYLAMKQAGESTSTTDSFLKTAVSQGLITLSDATELRDKRY